MLQQTYRQLWLLSVAMLFLMIYACGTDYTPKPRAYPRINFPEHAYKKFTAPACPFTFEQPTYSKVAAPKQLIGKPTHACWTNVAFDYFDANLHLSYSPIDEKENTLSNLINDSYKLSFKHVVKADYIEDSLFTTPKGITGIMYAVGGDAASSTQFFITDSTQHFLWASLYLESAPNADSIAPIIQFIRTDIDQLLETFEWEK